MERPAYADDFEGVVSVKSLLWFLVGVAGGFVVAHLVNKDPRGHELLAEVDARISEFTDAVGDAYREQESRFSDIVGGVRDAAADALDATKDAADTVAETVSDTAAQTVDAATDAAADAAKKLTD